MASVIKLQLAGQSLARIYRSIHFVPGLVCLVILLATILGTRSANASLHHEITVAAQGRLMTFEQLLQTQLDGYAQILRGGVGLFQGSNNVTQQDFVNYLAAYDLVDTYPAVQAIAFAKIFSARQIAGAKAYAAHEGVANFTLRPAEPARDSYAPVLYAQIVAAQVETPQMGYDNFSDPVRQTTMLRARDTAQTTITQVANTSPLETSKGPAPGFLMYTPYYGPSVPTNLADRQASIQGFMYAAFRSSVFFADITSHSQAKDVAFRITTNGQTAVDILFATTSFAKLSRDQNSIKMQRTFVVYNQTWTIDYALDPHRIISDVQLRRPAGVLFFGIFSAVLITTIVALLLIGRAKALADQKERDVELAKDELLSLASHQLRTPATGVKQYLGMLLQGFAGEIPRQQKLLLEKAYASNDRQLQSINEILHMAKINAGHIVLARQEVNIVGLVQDIVQEQRHDIDNAQHTIKLALPKRPIKLFADPHMLRMATENVLSNAIKYTPPGGQIRLVLARKAGMVRLAISDTGIGIKGGDFPKLFKQFSRLPNELHVSGTGVGLYLAKYLIELHDGTIEVESKSGKGSTFTISLPIAPNLEGV